MDVSRKIRNSSALAESLRLFSRAHIWVYQRTHGVVGSRLLWLPSALITTTGRRTGATRVTATLCVRDGQRIVVPASFGGRDHHPAWYLNVKSDPHIQVQLGTTTAAMIARDATPAERNRYWPQLTRLYPPYRGYRDATDRVIPLVICDPIPADA